MKGLWLGKHPPRGQVSHVPSGLCHVGLSLFFFRRLSEIRPSYFSTSRAFPSVVGGSNCQKETSPKTNALFMEIAEDKAILAWTLMGATGRKSPMVLRQKVSCLWLVVCDKLKGLPKAWLQPWLNSVLSYTGRCPESSLPLLAVLSHRGALSSLL